MPLPVPNRLHLVPPGFIIALFEDYNTSSAEKQIQANDVYSFYKEPLHHPETRPLWFPFKTAYTDTGPPRKVLDSLATAYITETLILHLPPTISICEDQSITPIKHPHLPSSLPVLDTPDDGNYNLKDTLAQIQAAIVAGFASLQQDVTSLQSQVTALITTNQVQAKKIQSLATTIQYHSTRTQTQHQSPNSCESPSRPTPRKLEVPAGPIHRYL